MWNENCFISGNTTTLFFKKQYIKHSQQTWKSLPDEDLIAAYIKSDDVKYLTELFERYTHLIFSVCMKYLQNEENCKDAVMSIFEELVRKIKKHEIKNFKNWVYTLTKNYCLMKLRKVKQFEKYAAQNKLSQKEEIMESLNTMHQYNAEEKAEQIKLLNSAIKSLNEEQEICIRLFYLEEKSYKEVEAITGFTAKQVKSFIQNGKRNLKLYLEANGK